MSDTGWCVLTGLVGLGGFLLGLTLIWIVDPIKDLFRKVWKEEK
jgi:hypothetical protein